MGSSVRRVYEAPRGSRSRLCHLGDEIGQREDPLGVAYVQALDHPTIDGDDAVPGGLRLLVSRHDLAGVRDLVIRRAEHVVGRTDLRRMDQRLAVETHFPTLSSLGSEAVFVLDVVEYA